MIQRIGVVSFCAAICGLTVAVKAPSRDGEARYTNIFVVNADGTGRRNLTRESRPATRVLRAISPDGRTLAFDRLRIEGGDAWWSIGLIPARGGGERTLVSFSGSSAYGPAWSRRGELVAFNLCCSPHGVGVVRHDGSGLTVIQGGSDPAWLPGKRLAFLGSGDVRAEIVTAKADGSDRRTVVHARDIGFDEFDGFSASPSGRTSAFSALGQDRASLLSIGLYPGAQPQVISDRARDFSWSPTSRRLVVVTNQGLATVGVDGTNWRRYRATQRLNPVVPMWSPDGTRIAFVSSSSSNLVVMKVRDGSRRVVARRVDGSRPLWSRNGRRLYFVAPRPS